jgi:hypothetical protein
MVTLNLVLSALALVASAYGATVQLEAWWVSRGLDEAPARRWPDKRLMTEHDRRAVR